MQRDLIVKSRSLGGSTDLILLAPIKLGFVDSLDAVTYKTRVKMLLDTLHALRRTSHEYAAARLLSDSIERVGVIQSVRVAVLEPEDKVLLVVTFDGNWQSYVRVLWDKVGTLLDLIFCSTIDYVTSHNHSFDEWAAWARRVQVETSFFYGSSGATARDALYYRRIERMSLRGLGNSLNETRSVLPSAQGALLDVVSNDPRPDQPPMNGIEHTHIDLETFNTGFAALAALYRLADLFRPSDADGITLRLATIDLLHEFVLACDSLQMNGVRYSLKKRYERQLKWLFPGSDPALRFKVQRKRSLPCFPEINDAIKTDVQGGILEPYTDISHGLTVLIAFSDVSAALHFLNAYSHQVTRADSEHLATSGRIFQNLAFTPNGLLACGLAQDQLEDFPEDFMQGMDKRCGTLGDVRNNHPRRWRLPYAFVDADKEPSKERQIEIGTVHAVLHLRVRAESDEELQTIDFWEINHPLKTKLTELSSMKQHGVNVLAVESMRRRYRRVGEDKVIVEHFGYADGGGQPNLATNTNSQPRSHLGEIVCGYSNSADALPSSNAETSTNLLRNGSFLVLRKYGQDVRKFNSVVDGVVSDLIPESTSQADKDVAKAMVFGKLMGRMQDGRSMVKPPAKPVTNDFSYYDDPVGSKCPLHAHVRLANPRTASPNAKEIERSGDSLSRPPVIMRRSMSYGPEYDPENAKDDKERGLMFMAYNASLSEQFEVIQRWLTQGNSTGSSSLQSCPIVGVPENHYPRQFRFEYGLGDQTEQVAHALLEPPTYMFTQPAAYTWLEWGMYLFAPSITALHALYSTALSVVTKSEAKKAHACPMIPSWSAKEGRAKLMQLQAIEATLGSKAALDAWKAAVEDPEAIRRLGSAGLWAAIREDHGGVLRTPYGVIVANRKFIQQIFKDNNNFSVCGHRERMLLSFGDIFIGKDASPEYTDEAGTIPDALSALPPKEVFKISKYAAETKLKEIVQTAKETAKDNGMSNFETGFDARELLDEVLADLTEHWFGIQDSEFFIRSGSDPNWQEGIAPHYNKPLYPGHFAAPSRYMFQPNPGETPTHLGQMHGLALKRAMLSFAAPFVWNCTIPKNILGDDAPIAKAVLEHARNSGKTVDFIASTMVGIIMGYTPTIYGAVLNVLSEWAKNDILFEKRTSWDGTVAMSYDEAYDLMHKVFSDATKMQPMPQITWRTTRTAMRLGEPGQHAIDIYPNDKIVLALVSGTQESLVDGVDDGRIMFGGIREESPHPTHACPGYHQGIAAALGCLAALVCLREKLQPGMTPHSFGIRGETGHPRSNPPKMLETFGQRISMTTESSKGTIICWGDSWVSYRNPFVKDIQAKLKDRNYETPEDFCRDNRFYLLSNMATDDNIKLFTNFLDGRPVSPKAIFLSGGGNDSVIEKLYSKPPQPELKQLLNHKNSGSSVINENNLNDHLAIMLAGYTKVIKACDASLQIKQWKTPIIVHGYAFPLPADRPIGASFNYWIKDPFKHAGYIDATTGEYDKVVATKEMQKLIKQLNKQVFEKLQNLFPDRVIYVDLQTIAPNETDWGNDMHLTGDKFGKAAGLVDEAITKFWENQTA